jgi:DNA polymerase-1
VHAECAAAARVWTGYHAGVSDTPDASRGRRLLVIDGANSIYRAFFAIPHLRAPDGSPTNAIYGFVTTLAKVLRQEAPDLVAVAFDPRGGSFRRRVFDGYKANRDAQPEDLSAQIPLVREVIDAFQIPLLEVEDFEADDVIATLVETRPDDVAVSILSTDKDLMQLVGNGVELIDPAKESRIGAAEVEARFGVPPDKMLDLRSLVGDPSDNIPGVKGIGEKGAAKLIVEYGSLEALLEQADDVKAKRAREALQSQKAEALLSKELSTLRRDVPLPVDFEQLERKPPDTARLRALYERLGFSRLLASLDEAEAGDAEAPVRAAADPGEKAEVEILSTAKDLEAWLESLRADEPLVLDLLCSEGSAVEAIAVGLAIARDDLHAAYVPLVGDARSAETGLDTGELIDVLRVLWPRGDDKPRAWSARASKSVQNVLGELGLELPPPTDDTEIAAFLLDPAGAHDVAAQAASELGRRLDSWEDVAGRGAKAVPAEALPVEVAAGWLGGQVCAHSALAPALRERLDRDGLTPLYDDVELPLTAVLSRMERAGVRIDEEKLAELGSEYRAKLAKIEEEIYALAGEEFLISSPKQLQVILFEKLGLPPLKKTKTGYSTAESVLDQLRGEHALPGKILDYRKLSKLMSTYIEALPPMVCERTGRIHPRFNQLGAATGRMSAQHPNVQNIPIRGEEGARIREAFVPAEGLVMLSADYSQVELRILAHYSGDESLIEAFRNAEDIHRRTAAEVWGVSMDDVNDEQRARAKAVNFGIIYGSSAFGLANQLGIASGEAQETIDAYFERYRGVRRFIDETIAHAKEEGFVVTMLGRRRYLPDLRSRNRVLRQAAERMAVNTVIQGTAADLIKRAMVDVDRAIRETGAPATLMLQVHDELVLETAEAKAASLTELLRERMEGALELSVPLVMDVGRGPNWRSAH